MDEWYDEFWANLGGTVTEDEDNATSVARLIGEMFRDGLIWRDGDNVKGREGNALTLDARDQWIVRQIEDAAKAATEGVAATASR